jgi:excisionase family DNA binding protein
MSRTSGGSLSIVPIRTHTNRAGRWEDASIRRLAVTVEEGARMLGVGRATLYKLVMRGDIESFTVGRARVGLRSPRWSSTPAYNKAPSSIAGKAHTYGKTQQWRGNYRQAFRWTLSWCS